MTAMKRIGLTALIAACAMTPCASAFPPFPPFQWPWHQAPDCPRSSYCCLHYTVPDVYTFRAYHTPPHYVYGGPVNPAFTAFRINRYPCRATSPEEQAARYLEYRERDVRAEPPLKSGQETLRETPDDRKGNANGKR